MGSNLRTIIRINGSSEVFVILVLDSVGYCFTIGRTSVYRIQDCPWGPKRRAWIAPGPPHGIVTSLGARIARLRCPILRAGNKIMPEGQERGKGPPECSHRSLLRNTHKIAASPREVKKATNASFYRRATLSVPAGDSIPQKLRMTRIFLIRREAGAA